MKKKILISLSLLVILILALCGCTKDLPYNDYLVLYNPKDDGMEVVKDLNAFSVMEQAFDYYKNNNKYKMTVDFVFNASPNFAYQVTSQTVVRTDSEYFEENIIMGTGGAKKHNKGNQFYYAGENNFKSKYIDAKSMTLDEKNNKVTADFSKTDWGKFNPTFENDGISSALDKVNNQKTAFHQYNLGDNYLSKDTDKKVYLKDNKYYCSVVINTKDMTDDIYQTAVVKAIEASTGGKFLRFDENTRIVAELEKVDGTFRFTQFILMEDYSGKVSILELNISQQYWHKFYYDANSLKAPFEI